MRLAGVERSECADHARHEGALDDPEVAVAVRFDVPGSQFFAKDPSDYDAGET
jgi:hypothetical protein